ncbi:MAG: methylmalonyl-CoA mutase family protein, partial [Bacteroidia bacterium]
MQKLFEEFPAITSQQWKEQLAKDLKGTDFNALIRETNCGFKINPFYTSEDLKQKKSPVFSHHEWDICSEIIADNAKEANRIALNELNGGATALLFYLYPGLELRTLLEGIFIEHIAVHFVFDFPAHVFFRDLNALLEERKLQASQLKGSVNIDPIENLIRTGNWKKEENADLDELIGLSYPLRTVCINATCYQNAGVTVAMELACALAHANEYISLSASKTGKLSDFLQKFQFNLAIGSDFFTELAKLRALRKLWNLLLEQYNAQGEVFIHCETTQVDKTSLDPYNNMLRTSTEAMSAILGGCNSLSVRPFDNTFKNANEFSSRIARNQQLILKEESYLDKVADAGAGSYYIENLTDLLA